jgi:guanosine-3',5'-bis(diphosphate) 3'-pyrophosphohydrolase
MPLPTRLRNGDEVEVLRSAAQVPPPAWEAIAVTGKARAAIRRASREQTRRQYAGLGRELVAAAFGRAGREFVETGLETALPRLGQTSLADAYAAVGRSDIPASDIVRAVHPDAAVGIGRAGGVPASAPAAAFEPHGVMAANGSIADAGMIPIRGVAGDMPVRFAPNGGAVPGDRIVGILTPGEGVTIYPIQSPALQSFDDQPDRWLDVRWDVDPEKPIRFPAQITVSSHNAPGSLAKIAQAISDEDVNIDNIRMLHRTSDFHELIIDVEVHDLKHVNRLLARLRRLGNVAKADRVNA